MQQERSFLRRVCVLKPFIYENCPSSRRAYFSIRLAVKTSRPHFYFRFHLKYFAKVQYYDGLAIVMNINFNGNINANV